MLELFGIAASVVMVTCYALEDRGPWYSLLFAGACLGAAGYAWAIASWPFVALETTWAGVAIARGFRRFQAQTRESTLTKGIKR